MSLYKFELFADYFQFYLMDVEANDDTSEIWSREAHDNKLGILKNTLAIGTFRNVDVKVEIELCEAEPSIDLEEWDHASIGYFEIISGECAVLGCTDYLPEAKTITLMPGIYSALSLAKGLDTITNEWEPAEDLYKVILWPSDKKEFKGLKSYDHT